MDKRLLFSTSTETLRLPSDRIVYISADGNYSAITTMDGENYYVTLQLGQVERRISQTLDVNDNRFIRIGKSLIVNSDFIALINPMRQKLVLSDCHKFRRELTASREALKALKDHLETEANNHD